MERLLDSVDAVCYLLDYTKLRTAEEASMFARIKSINPGLVKRLSRRRAAPSWALSPHSILPFNVRQCTDCIDQGLSRVCMLCRLFFVVNKVDTIRMSEGLDEDATREYVAELVTAQLSGDGFQLHPEQVRTHTPFATLLSSVSGCSPHSGWHTTFCNVPNPVGTASTSAV